MRNLLALSALLAAHPALSQENLPDLKDYLSEINAEVTANGELLLTPQGNARFWPDNHSGSFPVQFAIDRDTLGLAQEKCSAPSEITFRPENLCSARVTAEVSVDGNKINLLVFKISNISSDN